MRVGLGGPHLHVHDEVGGVAGGGQGAGAGQRLVRRAVVEPVDQGLTLVHFSAQLEPCPSQENTLHTLNTP
jgi:hypothetical protein